MTAKLINFELRNFRSFYEGSAFSAVASPSAELPDNAFDEGGGSLLKSAVIYGPNASGKTNLFRAFSFVKDFVCWMSAPWRRIPVERNSLVAGNENEAAEFEIEFLVDGSRYRYHLSATPESVVRESLSWWPNGRKKKYFERDGGKIELARDFKEGKGFTETGKIPGNLPFLKLAAISGWEVASAVTEFFLGTSVSYRGDDRTEELLAMAETESGKDRILKFLRSADINISDIAFSRTERPFEDLPPEMRAVAAQFVPWTMPDKFFVNRASFFHPKYDVSGNMVSKVEFDMNSWESEGTKRLVQILVPLFRAIDTGYPAFVDEIDSSLHPELVKRIVKAFHDPSENPKNAQLFFTAHSTEILEPDSFRRDQVWFVEKDRFGRSDVVPLTGFGIREWSNYAKMYREGKFWARPFVPNVRLSDTPDASPENG